MYFTGSLVFVAGEPTAAKAQNRAAQASAGREYLQFVRSGMKWFCRDRLLRRSAKRHRTPSAYSVGPRGKSTGRHAVFQGIARKDNGWRF